MSDLIKREDVMLRVGEFIGNKSYDELMLVNDLNALPSAEPERKAGKWLPHPTEREFDVCSVCGTGCKRREYELQYGQEKVTEYNYPYCPSCGAKLEWE